MSILFGKHSKGRFPRARRVSDRRIELGSSANLSLVGATTGQDAGARGGNADAVQLGRGQHELPGPSAMATRSRKFARISTGRRLATRQSSYSWLLLRLSGLTAPSAAD